VKNQVRSHSQFRRRIILLALAVTFAGGGLAACGESGGELRSTPLTRDAPGNSPPVPVNDGDAAEASSGRDPEVPADREAIRAAAVDYVRAETAVANVTVEIQAVGEGWARVRVIPTGGETDPALLFLRRIDGAWRGVAIGTAFTPEDQDRVGVPAAVRIGG